MRTVFPAAAAAMILLALCALQHYKITSLEEQLQAERAATRALNEQIKALRAAKPAPAPEIMLARRQKKSSL